MEYDLIALGLRLDELGTCSLSWRDLWVIVRQSPRGSAVHRSQSPDDAPWGLLEHLVAGASDALNVANWQRGSAKTADFPQPITRPGVEPPSKTIGSDPLPLDQMAAWLGWDY